jgi:hypothetical protein
MVRSGIEYLRDHAYGVERERFEKVDCVTTVVERLAYFEAWLTPEATFGVEGFRVLRSLVGARNH